MRFSMVLHGHQPPGNFDAVFERGVEQCYRPALELLQEFPELRCSVHLSGSLLEWLERHQPDVVRTLRAMVRRGQVEPVAAGMYEPVLALLPVNDRLNQLRAHRAYLERLFGVRPTTGWLTERVWTQALAADLANAGIETVALDDLHFMAAGLAADELGAPLTTEYLGRVLTVVPGREELRGAIPFATPHQTVNEIMRWARSGDELLVYADDLEKFGMWPGTYHTVFERGWLRQFCELLSERVARGDLEVVPLGEAVRAIPPQRRVYLPDGSYPEMLRWSLPAPAQRRAGAVEQALRDDETWEDARPFVRAGTYYQFLAKYPEVNHLHKRMLDVSARIATRFGTEQRDEALARPPEALRRLWLAQANCAYWHGWFGGTYLPFIRQANWRNLLRAEEGLFEAGERRHALRVCDLDADGADEAVITTDALTLVVASGEGALVELSDRERGVNFLDTLARREEAYHDADAPPYAYERARRAAFVDRFLAQQEAPAPDATTEDRGDFAGQPYAMEARRGRGSTLVTLVREAGAPGGVARVEKTLRIDDDAPRTVTAAYVVTGCEGTVDARFGIEINLATFFPEHLAGEVTLDTLGVDLLQGGAAHARTCAVRIHDPAFTVTIAADREADIDVRPVATVSMSESGPEEIRQALAVLYTWPLRLEPDDAFEVAMRLEISPPARRRSAR